ncbi:MAG TPA: hypothetical protein VKR22_06525 [Acidimicrobiales bacterium]|nr:hypothetical protein [Acidimicrobiales bacterium]
MSPGSVSTIVEAMPGSTSTITPVTNTAPPVPVVNACAGSRSQPAIRPRSVLVVCENAAVGVTGITWSSWGTVNALGNGTANVDDCRPDCASGTMRHYPASIYLYGPSSASEPVFQDITVTPSTSAGQFESSYIPGHWGVP